jgi:hypothetical protein
MCASMVGQEEEAACRVCGGAGVDEDEDDLIYCDTCNKGTCVYIAISSVWFIPSASLSTLTVLNEMWLLCRACILTIPSCASP